AALAGLLRRERTLLLEATDPRERAIVRGLQRLVRAPATSVYRKQPAPPKTARDAEEPALMDWVLAVAPDVAPFVKTSQVPDGAARGAGAPGGGHGRAAWARLARQAGRARRPAPRAAWGSVVRARPCGHLGRLPPHPPGQRSPLQWPLEATREPIRWMDTS